MAFLAWNHTVWQIHRLHDFMRVFHESIASMKSPAACSHAKMRDFMNSVANSFQNHYPWYYGCIVNNRNPLIMPNLHDSCNSPIPDECVYTLRRCVYTAESLCIHIDTLLIARAHRGQGAHVCTRSRRAHLFRQGYPGGARLAPCEGARLPARLPSPSSYCVPMRRHLPSSFSSCPPAPPVPRRRTSWNRNCIACASGRGRSSGRACRRTQRPWDRSTSFAWKHCRSPPSVPPCEQRACIQASRVSSDL